MASEMVAEMSEVVPSVKQTAPDTRRIFFRRECAGSECRGRTAAEQALRIRPYRTLENVIEGAVITFTEITEIKKAQTALWESEDLRRLAVVVRDAHDAIAVQDREG